MAVSTGGELAPGTPRSAADAAFLRRFDAVMRLPLIFSAILPLIVAPQQGHWLSIVIGIVTWLVFLVDYVVHRRHVVHYGRTGFGRFDLVVVVVTAPWYLIPGAQGGAFVVLLRLARVARVLMASRGSRQLFDRLGRVAGVALGVTATASLVAYYAEHPTNPEFANVGDAFWWGVVTLTTVGYGDIVPKTPTGRWAAVVIMFTGIAVLGVLAGSLASFLRLQPDDDRSVQDDSFDSGATTDAVAAAQSGIAPSELGTLVAEVAALSRQVASLTARVAELGSSQRPPGSGSATEER
jgi:voltage-gated potassium channel